MDFDFSGKTAIVTGGTRGIGRSIAELLLSSGAQVIYTGTKADPERPLKGAQYAELHLDDRQSIRRFAEQVLNPLSALHIFLNNAGISIIEPIDAIKDEHWDKVLQINLTGAMMMMRCVAQKMKSSDKGGRILNISSIWGVIAKAKRASYSASKAGLIGFTRAVALDLAPWNILVNALCPGFTRTELTESILSADEIKELAQQIPLKRFAEVDDIARIALFLCSDLNTYITGQSIVVDGGFTIQ